LRENIHFDHHVSILILQVAAAAVSATQNSCEMATDSQVQEALALIQKTSPAGGGSLHDNLVKLLVKVWAAYRRACPPKQAQQLTTSHLITAGAG
jgi:hypothetical protein